MPRVIWTESASAQLADIEFDELEDQLIALAFGLNRFPERGRRVPELAGDPEYNIAREVILTRKARLLYMFIPDSDEVLVLGIIFKGGIFRRELLGSYFNP
jgi:plasmid stabilization system protein ParE